MADVKICGLSTDESVSASIESGARYLGFNFYPPSPRSVTAARAAELAAPVPPGIAKVGLFVDPDDSALDAVLSLVPLDFLQLHKVTDPERLARIRQLSGLPIILAHPVARAEDVDAALELDAEIVMFDAKPAEGAKLPGGNGIAFDWRILANRRIARPWLLAGGLTPENVTEAILLTGAKQLDVASGVESAPGVKDIGCIRAFLAAAKS